MFQFQHCKRRRKVFPDLRFLRMVASPQMTAGKVDLKVTIGRELCDAMGFRVGFQLLGAIRTNATGSQYVRLWFPNSRATTAAPDFILDFTALHSSDDRSVSRKTISQELLSGFIAPPQSFIGHLSRDEVHELSDPTTAPDVCFLRPESVPDVLCVLPGDLGTARKLIEGEPDGDVRSLLASMESFVHQADPVLTASSGSDDSFDGVWCRVLEHASGDILNRFARSASRMCADIIAVSGRGGK
jgi:hypothetical protein